MRLILHREKSREKGSETGGRQQKVGEIFIENMGESVMRGETRETAIYRREMTGNA